MRISSFASTLLAEFVNLSLFSSWRFDHTVMEATSKSRVARTSRVQTAAERRLDITLAFAGAMDPALPLSG